MEAVEFLNDIELPEFFLDFEEVFSAIDELCGEENVEETSNFVLESQLFKFNKKAVADIIIKLLQVRNNRVIVFAKLAEKLIQESSKFAELLIAKAQGRFRRALYTEGAITLSQVLEKIQNEPAQKVFFAPELNLTNEKEPWNLISKNVTVDDLLANNWRLFHDLIEAEYQENSIEFSLKEDDVDYFINLAASPSFNPKQEYIEKAAIFGATKCFKYLSLVGCKITEKVVENAIKGGDLEIVRVCEQFNGSFKNALVYAAEMHRNDIFDWILLTKEVATPKVVDVVEASNYKAVLYLIDQGADVDGHRKFRKAPLHIAAQNDDVFMARILLAANANPDIHDMNGKTPLHMAKSKEMMELLIDAGADINAKDKSGATPLFAAIQNNDSSLMTTLIQRGCDINAENILRKNALYYAKEWKKNDAIKILTECAELGNVPQQIKNNQFEVESYPTRIILE